MPTAASDVDGLMKAAVYVGNSHIEVQSVPVPRAGPGEMLVKVHACGICHTDLKKVEHNLLAPPRIFGHETAGEVVDVGAGVTAYRPGDRVIAFHHIPCRDCFYCRRKLYAQCGVYKKVGITAGFEPAGGGFAQYIRIMDWVVRDGIERIPDGVTYEQAAFVEPVNTCLKAVTEMDPQPEDVVLIQGQGPIGLIFTMLAARTGARVITSDTMPARRRLSIRYGALESLDPKADSVPARMKEHSGGRGADQVFVAASARGIVEEAVRAARPGARIMLFAQTSDTERIELSGADICKEERAILGCYSASIDLQAESARLVFDGDLPVEGLVSHRLPIDEIERGIALALRPGEQSLKIMVQPQRWS
ncbi:MAG: alcohol dehydrogenase catalytic domain-containing protein [Bryobacterales bacterium]|nr:alcohol dehydrogenase catalytic domain-containing protein [Bryobacterales bacterium]